MLKTSPLAEIHTAAIAKFVEKVKQRPHNDPVRTLLDIEKMTFFLKNTCRLETTRQNKFILLKACKRWNFSSKNSPQAEPFSFPTLW